VLDDSGLPSLQISNDCRIPGPRNRRRLGHRFRGRNQASVAERGRSLELPVRNPAREKHKLVNLVNTNDLRGTFAAYFDSQLA
jgi:hypothetical protein